MTHSHLDPRSGKLVIFKGDEAVSVVLTLLAWARLFVSGYTSTSRTISWVPRHLFESSLSFLVPEKFGTVNFSVKVAGMDYAKMSHSELVDRLRKDDRTVFGFIYRRYSSDLYRYLGARIHTPNDCDEILIDVFVNLWLDRHNLSNDLKSHLGMLCRIKLAMYASDNPSSNLFTHLKVLFYETCKEKDNQEN